MATPVSGGVSSTVFWGSAVAGHGRIHFATLVGEFQFGLAILLTLSF
jgi:hypothetical protein